MEEVRNIVMIAFAFVAISAYPQTSITASVGVSIVVPVSAKAKEQLTFGLLASNAGNGTLKISPDNIRLATGNIVTLDNRFNAAKFIFSGEPNNLVSLMMPGISKKQLLNNKGFEAGCISFSSDFLSGGQTINSNGKIEINIGATLELRKCPETLFGISTVIYEVVFVYN